MVKLKFRRNTYISVLTQAQTTDHLVDYKENIRNLDLYYRLNMNTKLIQNIKVKRENRNTTIVIGH